MTKAPDSLTADGNVPAKHVRADLYEAQAAEIERLRGDLNRAVEALERVSNSQPRPKRNGDYDRSDVSALQRIARTALAELTGAQKDGY